MPFSLLMVQELSGLGPNPDKPELKGPATPVFLLIVHEFSG